MNCRSGSSMVARRNPSRFTAAQEAAVAKLAYAAEHAGAVALLCGPAGVGKTMLLRHVAASGLPTAGSVRLCAGRESCLPTVDRPAVDGRSDLLLVDDADRLNAAGLVDLVEAWQRQRPGIVIVLAGQGRLLSLCGSDRRLEQLVRLRATLPTFMVDESRDLLRPLLGATSAAHAAGSQGDDVLETIHDISGGVPAVALRLADMAGVLVAADPGRRLSPDDIEAIHRRLCLNAA